MIEKLLSPLSKELWIMLDDPSQWEYSHSKSSEGLPFYILHKETLVCLWTVSGRWFLNGYNETIFEFDDEDSVVKTLGKTKVPRIGCFDRHILWGKVKKVMKHLDNIYSTEGKLFAELKEYNSGKVNA